MDMQRTDGPGAEPGLEGAEANGVRLATTIDPRLAEVWTTLFLADLDAADLSEQVGWFLRMAYLRGYHDGLCEPDAGSPYRDLGMREPPRRRTATTRPGTTHRREAYVIIDCIDCEAQETEHCQDCFVMALRAPLTRPVIKDPAAEAACTD